MTGQRTAASVIESPSTVFMRTPVQKRPAPAPTPPAGPSGIGQNNSGGHQHQDTGDGHHHAKRRSNEFVAGDTAGTVWPSSGLTPQRSGDGGGGVIPDGYVPGRGGATAYNLADGTFLNTNNQVSFVVDLF